MTCTMCEGQGILVDVDGNDFLCPNCGGSGLIEEIDDEEQSLNDNDKKA